MILCVNSEMCWSRNSCNAHKKKFWNKSWQ